jgi:hypothetical protein
MPEAISEPGAVATGLLAVEDFIGENAFSIRGSTRLLPLPVLIWRVARRFLCEATH